MLFRGCEALISRHLLRLSTCSKSPCTYSGKHRTDEFSKACRVHGVSQGLVTVVQVMAVHCPPG